MKKKILVTTGTRSEYGILRPLLKKIQQSKKLELLLVVTGTHLSKKHGYTINQIKKDGFKISKKIHMIPKSDENFSMALTLGKGVVDFTKCFRKLKPDVNVIFGDRDEMLASALAASHMNIVNAHIHGGDVSGGLDEYNRHAITKISNIHFAASQKSKKRILKMGEDKKYVFFTGSPSIDEVKSKKISSKQKLEKKYQMKFSGNEILLVQHPVTTESNNAEKQIISTLNAIQRLNCNVIAISPNSDSGYRKIFKQLNDFSKKYKPKTIADIGCNDGTLLGNYQNMNLELIGFDPAENMEQYSKKTGAKIIVDYFNSSSFRKNFGEKKVKIVTSIAMFYDLDDPNEFVSDIYECLTEDGILSMNLVCLICSCSIICSRDH